MTHVPDRTILAPGLEISRLITGLWQIADMERDGRKLDLDALALDMKSYAEAGFDSFDMADHYGSAEDIAGRFTALCVAGARPGDNDFLKFRGIVRSPGIVSLTIGQTNTGNQSDNKNSCISC